MKKCYLNRLERSQTAGGVESSTVGAAIPPDSCEQHRLSMSRSPATAVPHHLINLTKGSFKMEEKRQGNYIICFTGRT